jgi:hypothetical protein
MMIHEVASETEMPNGFPLKLRSIVIAENEHVAVALHFIRFCLLVVDRDVPFRLLASAPVGTLVPACFEELYEYFLWRHDRASHPQTSLP